MKIRSKTLAHCLIGRKNKRIWTVRAWQSSAAATAATCRWLAWRTSMRGCGAAWICLAFPILFRFWKTRRAIGWIYAASNTATNATRKWLNTCKKSALWRTSKTSPSRCLFIKVKTTRVCRSRNLSKCSRRSKRTALRLGTFGRKTKGMA